MLEKAFNLRQNGDYEPEPIITEKDAKEMLLAAKEFLEEAKEYLEKQNEYQNRPHSFLFDINLIYIYNIAHTKSGSCHFYFLFAILQ